MERALFVLVLCVGLAVVVTAAPEPGCPHGKEFIDECDNDCSCVDNKFYGCTRKACRPGQRPEVPRKCEGSADLPIRSKRRVFCHEGIVKVQDVADTCVPGSNFMAEDRCNSCFCSDAGVAGCTLKLCPEERPSPPTGDTELCAGETQCPPDCSLVSRNQNCIFCQCGAGPLAEGEVVVGAGDGCPPGTVLNRQLGEIQTCVPGGPGLPQPPAAPGCAHGNEFIDECDNDCKCIDNKFYGCTRKACRPGQRPEVPRKCKGTADLPRRTKRRVFCHEGIVKVQNLDDKCLPGSNFLDEEYCNGCFCSDTGAMGCTLKACIPAPDAKTKSGDDGIIELPGTDLPAPGDSPGCPHGDAFIDECGNQCTCSKGMFYGCTFKACLDGKRPEVPMTCNGPADVPKLSNQRVVCHQGIVKVQAKEDKCIPGSEFMEECNSCSCTDGGVAACTLKACVGQSRVSCKYGPAYIDECGNDCACFDGSFYGCSRRGCPSGLTASKPMSCGADIELPTRRNSRVSCHQGIVKVQRPEEQCLPGATFLEDCNRCTCSDNGVPGCTLKACLPKPKDVCVHGDEFIDECGNQCKCQNGEFYGCTFKACQDGQTPQLPMKCDGAGDLPQVPGRRVFCHDGKVKIQDEDAKCVPGSSFRSDCNTCTCSESAVPGCTRKACVSVAVNENQAGCPHGPHFIDECNNDCTCAGGQYGCTFKACKPGETPQVPMKCEGSGGLPKRGPTDRVFCHDGKVKVQPAEDDNCVPGSAFMDQEDCNQCFCSEKGVIGCTLKLCLD